MKKSNKLTCRNFYHWQFLNFEILVVCNFDPHPKFGSKFGTPKCRTADISKFRNCNYKNNGRFANFILKFNFSGGV